MIAHYTTILNTLFVADVTDDLGTKTAELFHVLTNAVPTCFMKTEMEDT